MAIFRPVLGFYGLNGTALANNTIDFGKTQPGGFSSAKVLELWNNKCTNPNAYRNPTTGAIDVTQAAVKAINVSFPDATDVKLKAVKLSDGTAERFNQDGVEPTKDDAAPITDWLLEVAVCTDPVANTYGPFQVLTDNTIIAAVLSGKNYDPYNDTLEYNASKFVRFKVRMFLPSNATGNEDFRFILKPESGIGQTSPAGPGAINYTLPAWAQDPSPEPNDPTDPPDPTDPTEPDVTGGSTEGTVVSGGASNDTSGIAFNIA